MGKLTELRDLLLERTALKKMPPPARNSHAFAMWVLEAWRATGDFCDIELCSDYDFVWDVWWVMGRSLREEVPTQEQPHTYSKIAQSFDRLEDAIIEGALAALGMPSERIVVTHGIRRNIVWPKKEGE